jgi:hypothetical protein
VYGREQMSNENKPHDYITHQLVCENSTLLQHDSGEPAG